MKPEELAEEFAQNVSAQTDAIWNGDAKTGNKHAKRYVAAFKKFVTMATPDVMRWPSFSSTRGMDGA